MAIYHLHAKPVSRGKGLSVVAKAAYNARETLLDERTDQTKDYRDRGEILFSGIFAPKDAPDWVQDRERLWNAVEAREKRPDSQLAIDIDLALPHELTDQQRQWLVTDFVREQFQRKGVIADVNIHPPPHEPGREGDKPNHHAHILLALREIGPDGFGERILNTQDRELEAHRVENWREAWERTVNRHLERHGFEERIDRRTLEEQGIDREPTTHRGPTVDAMERRGIETNRGAEIRETQTGPLLAAGTAYRKEITDEANRELREAVIEARDNNQETQARDDLVNFNGWFRRIEDAIERGAGSDTAQQRHSEGKLPEGWLARKESASTLEEMRELRAEIGGMRKEIRGELEDTTISREYREGLREIADVLCALHFDTNMEIVALRIEQGGYTQEAVTLGRDRLSEFAQTMESIGAKSADLLGGVADLAAKAVDAFVDFWITPSLPTQEQVIRQVEHQEQTKFDARRYETDDAYRDEIRRQDAEQARQAQEAERKYHEQDRHDRGLDGRERWERER
jgi:hypothetical protein